MHWTSLIPSTDFSPLIETAFRGLLLAVLVAAGLWVFRVRSVVAQKAAWILVLAAAFAMPALIPLADRIPVPDAAAANLYLHRAQRFTAISNTAAVSPLIAENITAEHIGPMTDEDDSPSSTAAIQSGGTTPGGGVPANNLAATPQPRPTAPLLTRLQFLFLLYCGVCATMLFRMVRGVALATRLWQAAAPAGDPRIAQLAGSIPVRASARIVSPLNIGSGILLPADYPEWDDEKLAIVLAHEASHVRQRDFYLQIAAQLYAAIFWFSPLGWWMGRKLSDLSEAISDHAGLHNAASPAAYAQVLLEFAALARPTTTGVAMARPGRLSQRIERLLNESSFRHAFTVSRVRIAAAVLVVPISVFAATALVRVHAAQVPQTPVTPAPSAEPPHQPEPAPTPNALAGPHATPPARASKVTEAVLPKLNGPITLRLPAVPSIAVNATTPPIPAISLAIQTPPVPPATIVLNNEAPIAFAIAQNPGGSDTQGHDHTNNYGAYTFEGNGPTFYGFFERYGGSPHYTGSWTKGHEDAIAKAEQLAKGDFILYTNAQGKSYYIDDPTDVAQMEAYYRTVRSLDRQKWAMERAQQDLARAQSRMAEQQGKANVTKADLQADLAGLSAAIAKLQARKESAITADQLSELESKLGQMQGKLIQIQVADRLSTMHFDTAALEKRLAAIKAQQGGFNWNGTVTNDGKQVMKSLIEEGLKNGKAKPVN
ncbi:MAG: M56 family metallopeptidase [Acidobacteriota bacterium]